MIAPGKWWQGLVGGGHRGKMGTTVVVYTIQIKVRLLLLKKYNGPYNWKDVGLAPYLYGWLSELHDTVCMQFYILVFSPILLTSGSSSFSQLRVVGMATTSSQSRGTKGASLSSAIKNILRQDWDCPAYVTSPSLFQFCDAEKEAL